MRRARRDLCGSREEKIAHDEINTVLALYGLDRPTAQVQSLEATHRAYRVCARRGQFALRQYNRYMQPDHLAAQVLLADLLQETSVRTPPAIRTRDGRRFAEVNGRLWAMFPWCDGSAAQRGNAQDHRRLAVAAGQWARGVQQAANKPRWSEVEGAAALVRRRKDWAWVVPLDRVPEFATEIGALDRMQRESPAILRQEFLAAAGDVEACIENVTAVARQQGVADLPRGVTHGDLFPENLLVGPDGLTLIDLDCFCFEPRAADLARAACRLYGAEAEAGLRELLPEFQRTAELTRQEIDAIELLMAGYHLYYAIVHGLLLVVDDPEQRPSTLKRIAAETAACRQAIRRC